MDFGVDTMKKVTGVNMGLVLRFLGFVIIIFSIFYLFFMFYPHTDTTKSVFCEMQGGNGTIAFDKFTNCLLWESVGIVILGLITFYIGTKCKLRWRL